jgi:hypothetical protein
MDDIKIRVQISDPKTGTLSLDTSIDRYIMADIGRSEMEYRLKLIFDEIIKQYLDQTDKDYGWYADLSASIAKLKNK